MDRFTGKSLWSGPGCYQCGPDTATNENRSQRVPTFAVQETEEPQLLPVQGRAGRGPLWTKLLDPEPGEKAWQQAVISPRF